MSCEYCNQLPHDSRCPLYKPEKPHYYCAICDEGIYKGHEYVENDNGEKVHYECCEVPRKVLKWFGYKVKEMNE